MRGDAYTWDCGYPLPTELEDERIFVAYYFTAQESDESVPEHAAVRHVAATLFKLA